MKKTLFLLFSWSVNFCLYADHCANLMYVDFDTSMQASAHTKILERDSLQRMYAFFKRLYEYNSFKQIHPQNECKIPKIIHQVWLGSPLPDEYKAFVQSWKDFHPDWEYILWTDEKVAHELQLDNQCYYDEAVNYGEKSDILKWELIYRFGGVYIDVDFECLQPLDVLHYMYDFYTGV